LDARNGASTEPCSEILEPDKPHAYVAAYVARLAGKLAALIWPRVGLIW
jgi:hypothetical protein